MIEFKNYDPKIDDIIFSVNENDDYVAYKIINILTNNKAEVAIPAIDEIYDELEVYGEYQIDFEDNNKNSNTEAKLVKDIQNSDFFDKLIKSAYASDNNTNEKIKIEHKQNIKNNTLKSKVTLTFEPTKDGLFNNKDLINTTVELVLTNDYDLSVFVDIDNIKDWNISAIQNAKFHWEPDIVIDEFNDESLLYNLDILESIPNKHKKNNSLDTWTLQLKDANFQDSIILYYTD